MIGHIVKREFFDHLNSLRFALTTLILAALMVTNAVVHLQSHPDKVRRYSENITADQNKLQSRTELYELLKEGPGTLYKQPSALTFIADGGDAFLPNRGTTNWGSWSRTTGSSGKVRSIWSLDYPTANPNARNLRPKATKIDWVFIITYLLSFIPLLFTFDALSGERERGTLRLCLANPISRPALLVGKFLGTLITVLIPFVFAVLLNLAVISLDSWTQLGAADWGRLGMIMLIASGYTSIFIAVGLMVSASTRDSRVSLVVLLIVWVALVVFMPSTLGTLATKWMSPVQTAHQRKMARSSALEQINEDFDERMRNKREAQSPAASLLNELEELWKTSPEEAEKLAKENEAELRLAVAQLASQKAGPEELRIRAELINRDVEVRERLNREHLSAQLAQVQRARMVTRFSPAAIVQYALQSMTGTGLNRHLQFLKGVDIHIKQFRDFITETDRADTESLHIIGVPEGMSKKPISPQALPRFEDKITFSDTFNAAIVDMLLLVLLLGVFLSGAFLVFIRSDV
ncbi:MAG: ABC transporter permease subunit [Candidatus Poribacteria bacterium]|nr:ABC transporter permease subunit [Candidatus Poribacteria bacterium]